MPIFEFRCQGCAAEFELVVQASTQIQCPKCSGTVVEKKLSVFAVAGGGGGEFQASMGPCGTCGDPRGPGSCKR